MSHRCDTLAVSASLPDNYSNAGPRRSNFRPLPTYASLQHLPSMADPDNPVAHLPAPVAIDRRRGRVVLQYLVELLPVLSFIFMILDSRCINDDGSRLPVSFLAGFYIDIALLYSYIVSACIRGFDRRGGRYIRNLLLVMFSYRITALCPAVSVYPPVIRLFNVAAESCLLSFRLEISTVGSGGSRMD